MRSRTGLITLGLVGAAMMVNFGVASASTGVVAPSYHASTSAPHPCTGNPNDTDCGEQSPPPPVHHRGGHDN